MKDKERVFKAARGKERVTYQGVPIKLLADLSKETVWARKGLESIPSHECKDLHPRTKLSFRMEGANKVLPK